MSNNKEGITMPDEQLTVLQRAADEINNNLDTIRRLCQGQGVDWVRAEVEDGVLEVRAAFDGDKASERSLRIEPGDVDVFRLLDVINMSIARTGRQVALLSWNNRNKLDGAAKLTAILGEPMAVGTNFGHPAMGWRVGDEDVRVTFRPDGLCCWQSTEMDMGKAFMVVGFMERFAKELLERAA